MAGCVVSVEAVSISVGSGSSTGSANLSKGQTLANCVVVPSWYGPNASHPVDINADWDFKVTLESGPDRVVATRGGSTGGVDLTVYVIEFDPAQAKVQQVAWSMTNGGTTASPTIDSLDRGDAWVISSWNTNDITDDHDSGMIRYRINANGTQLDFVREAGSIDGTDGDDVDGIAYVVEALSGQWTVEHLENTGVASANVLDTDLASAITLARSFIIGTQSNANVGDHGRNVWEFGFLDTDTIRANRHEADADGGTLWMQAIQLASDVGTVEEVLSTLTDTAETTAETITTVSLDQAVIISSSNPRSQTKTFGTGNTSKRASFVECELTGTAQATFRHETSGTTRESEVTAYVIEWELVAGGVQGTVNQTLANATLAASGEVDVDAALAATLENATLVATTALQVQATLAATLQDATLEATAGMQAQASLAATLQDATLEATTSVQVEASLDQTLEDATLASSGEVDVEATLAATLEDATLDASAAVQVQGTLDATLEDATLAAAGSLGLQAAVDATLADATLAAQGAIQVLASLVATLEDATLIANDAAIAASAISTVPSIEPRVDARARLGTRLEFHARLYPLGGS